MAGVQECIAMICPKCNAAMETVSVEGIEVERCTGCRGLFFDAREHEKLKDIRRAAETLDIGTPAAKAEGGGAVTATATTKSKTGTKKIQCPSCHTQMIEMAVQGRAWLKFESCTVCHGAYFDAGEFKAYAGGGGVTGFLKGLFGRR
jgi:Zn-finger nucleic acid-binding protein